MKRRQVFMTHHYPLSFAQVAGNPCTNAASGAAIKTKLLVSSKSTDQVLIYLWIFAAAERLTTCFQFAHNLDEHLM